MILKIFDYPNPVYDLTSEYYDLGNDSLYYHKELDTFLYSYRDKKFVKYSREKAQADVTEFAYRIPQCRLNNARIAGLIE